MKIFFLILVVLSMFIAIINGVVAYEAYSKVIPDVEVLINSALLGWVCTFCWCLSAGILHYRSSN